MSLAAEALDEDLKTHGTLVHYVNELKRELARCVRWPRWK